MNKPKLPNEIWIHILSFIDDYSAIIASKRVNKIFDNYQKPRSDLKAIKDVAWQQDTIDYFAKRKLPDRVSKAQIKQIYEKQPTTLSYRVVISGPEGSGKTTLRNEMANTNANDTLPVYIPNINSDGVPSKMTLFEWYEEKVGHSWDRYKPNPRQCYRGVNVLVILFSLNDRSSFTSLVETWLQTIYFIRDSITIESINFLLVGTKVDLDDRQVSKAEAQMLAHEFKFPYMEMNTSDEKQVEVLKTTIIETALGSLYYQVALENPAFKLDAKEKSNSRCSIC
jgi:GTPase SAR1 family protein